MYHSLKRQCRVRVTGQRRTMSAKPIKSGRAEGSIASSDEGDLVAISNAMRKGQPLFFIRTDDGVTLDVLLMQKTALDRLEAIIDRNQNGRPRVHVWERQGVALRQIA